MIKLTIDSQEIEAAEGTTILAAADRLGIRIPRFCHHPRLSTPGNCRMCLVEVAGETSPVISCATPVREGMVVRTSTPELLQARADVLEYLLLNHPLDCPVCDKSGECDLQSLYVEHSLRPSRLTEPKVRKAKAQRIGPRIVLDAERCIHCTRCERFCEEIAGRHEIGLHHRGDATEIGVGPVGALSNPYSLCTVDLCPVGALTSVDFRFRKRVWLLESSPTICTGCARGCNAWLDHAGGQAYRLRPRENAAVNRSWMCDEGRMTHHAIDVERRLPAPMLLRGHGMEPVGWEEALAAIAALVEEGGASEVVGILSSAASLEENAAAACLAREALGARRLLVSGKPLDPAFGDAILRCADRNANAPAAVAMADGPVGHLPRNAGVIILDGLAPDDLMHLVDARPRWVVLLASECVPGVRWADVVLPKATAFEQEGTFLNVAGRLQRASAIFPPPSACGNAWAIAGRIAAGLGRAWSLPDAAACRAWARKAWPELSALCVDDLPPEGVVL